MGIPETISPETVPCKDKLFDIHITWNSVQKIKAFLLLGRPPISCYISCGWCTPLKINMEHNHGGLVPIIFLFKWKIYRWTMLIFQGVPLLFFQHLLEGPVKHLLAKRSLPGATELESPQAAADPVEPRCLAPWKLRRESPRTRDPETHSSNFAPEKWMVLEDDTGWWFHIFFCFHPYLGEWSILTNIFQMGWNHQLGYHFLLGIKNAHFQSRTLLVSERVNFCNFRNNV